MTPKPPLRRIARLLLPSLLLLVLAMWLSEPARSQWLNWRYWQAILKLESTLRLVASYHIESDGEYQHLTDAALEGLAYALDDYSAYLPAQQFKEFEDESRQQYVGIGVEIEQMGDLIIFRDVFSGGPAEAAGVKPGDSLLAVDGNATEGADLETAIERLTGLADTRVTITLFRTLTSKTLDFEITRQIIIYPTVRDLSLDENGIAYLRLIEFGERSSLEMAEALGSFPESKLRGLILDLRNNPGGILEEAVWIADDLLEAGPLLLSIEGADGFVFETFTSENAPLISTDVPIAVLVDRYTASAAEILAGILQDHGRAILIGEKTFGKGSVQSIFELGDKSGFKLTTARYRLPGGRSVHGIGLEPDFRSPEAEAYELSQWAARSHQHLGRAAFRKRFGFERPADHAREQATQLLLGLQQLR